MIFLNNSITPESLEMQYEQINYNWTNSTISSKMKTLINAWYTVEGIKELPLFSHLSI